MSTHHSENQQHKKIQSRHKNTNHETYRLDHGLDKTHLFSYDIIYGAVGGISVECQQIRRATTGPRILEAVSVRSVGFAGCT